MNNLFAYGFPVFAALLYALSSLYLKRSLDEGVGLMRTVFVANLVGGFVFLPVVLLQQEPLHWQNWHLPLITAVFFFIGQITTFLAIRLGDVSILNPTLGVKVVFVALIGFLFFDLGLTAIGWLSVIFATLAVIILGWKPAQGSLEGKRILLGLGSALVSALFFAVSDNLVAAWSPHFGRPTFVVAVFFWVAIFSFSLIPFFNAPLREIRSSGWKWVLPGSSLIGVQALIFNLALSYSNPATANTIYASRGIFAVILVILVGHWFGNTERTRGTLIMAQRFIGSLIILLAIVLMLRWGVRPGY